MFTHYPIFHREIINIIKHYQPSTIIDFTFGLGGHSKLILENTHCNLIAVDCDEKVLPWVEKLKNQYPQRFTFIHKKFSQALDQLVEENVKADWFIGDFGLSSMQIDDASRGFSFSQKGPLNMAMDNESHDRCRYLINESSITELADIIKKYGQERNYYNIAKNIIRNRPIENTHQLRKAIESQVFDKNFLNKSLARVFQAVRIYTNNELEEINYLLKNIHKITNNPGFCWIYFHSLEGDEVHQWAQQFKNQPKELLEPSDEELSENSRSRSAKMLVIKPKKIN
jgi:16S rRNA (cytosine1402-N4)-methyltransferase